MPSNAILEYRSQKNPSQIRIDGRRGPIQLGPILFKISSLWKVFILAFLGSIPSRCISPPDEFGFCLFEINSYNSVAYFQMILASIVILMAVAFITYLPQYDITKDRIQNSLTTSMLVTDVGISSCWQQVWYVGDRFWILQSGTNIQKSHQRH